MLSIFFNYNAIAQKDTDTTAKKIDTLPYLKYPTIPAFVAFAGLTLGSYGGLFVFLVTSSFVFIGVVMKTLFR